jgi:hypothetical protein
MQQIREFFSFWWRCAKNAAKGNSAFANDWQWLFGYPAIAVALWVAGYFYAELSGKIEMTLWTAGLGALAAAAVAFAITWLAAFFVRLANAPVVLYRVEKEWADLLQSKLDGDTDDALSQQRKSFVERAMSGLGKDEIDWLKRMIVTDRPKGIPDLVWRQLDDACLVGGDFHGPKGIKDELKSSVIRALAALSSRRLNLVVGSTDGLVTSLPPRGIHDIQRTYNLRIENLDREKPLTDCKISILNTSPDPPPPRNIPFPWKLRNGFSLSAGEQIYIPLATYGEARDRAKYDCGEAFMRVHAETDEDWFFLESSKQYILEIRATSPDSAYCDIKCKLWVDGDGRFQIEKI